MMITTKIASLFIFFLFSFQVHGQLGNDAYIGTWKDKFGNILILTDSEGTTPDKLRYIHHRSGLSFEGEWELVLTWDDNTDAHYVFRGLVVGATEKRLHGYQSEVMKGIIRGYDTFHASHKNTLEVKMTRHMEIGSPYFFGGDKILRFKRLEDQIELDKKQVEAAARLGLLFFGTVLRANDNSYETDEYTRKVEAAKRARDQYNAGRKYHE